MDFTIEMIDFGCFGLRKFRGPHMLETERDQFHEGSEKL
jgi:hypothetical protein